MTTASKVPPVPHCPGAELSHGPVSGSSEIILVGCDKHFLKKYMTEIEIQRAPLQSKGADCTK